MSALPRAVEGEQLQTPTPMTSPRSTPTSPHPGGRRRAAPALFAAALVVVAVVVTATWMITWSVVGEDDSPASAPSASTAVSNEDTILDTVRATTESIYNFTPDTIRSTMKSAQALLCGTALQEWNDTADSLLQTVTTTGRSLVTSNAHYGIARQDAESVTVLAVFEVSASQDNAEPAPIEPAAIEFTVSRSAIPLCVNMMKVL